jgi:uncharacterized RmlC-like cupin family protein
MSLPEQAPSSEPEYLLVRAAEAPKRSLRHGRGGVTELLDPKLIAGGSVISKVVIDPGTQPGPFHLHEYATNVYIGLEGEAQIRVADQTVALGPFDLIFIPAGVPHATHNASDRPVSLLAMYDRSVTDDFVVVNEGA